MACSRDHQKDRPQPGKRTRPDMLEQRDGKPNDEGAEYDKVQDLYEPERAERQATGPHLPAEVGHEVELGPAQYQGRCEIQGQADEGCYSCVPNTSIRVGHRREAIDFVTQTFSGSEVLADHITKVRVIGRQRRRSSTTGVCAGRNLALKFLGRL